MSTQRYSVTPHSIDTLLAWVRSGEIAIPEIQRPFVWDGSKVRNLLDSLYKGFPVGYLIAWRNPTVRLKNGSLAAGKRILIDGQQRVTALMAAILGQEVLTRDYRTTTIKIAFNPAREIFEVSNPAIEKDPAWIANVATVFDPKTSAVRLTKAYAERNPDADPDTVSMVLERLRGMTNNHVGVIELDGDLDIETVTEIFIRVNSAGAALGQADFVMSKIASTDRHGGPDLRKAIDYFCHMATSPEFGRTIERGDTTFAASDYYAKMKWLAGANDDLYDPSYVDMLRVAFTSEFGRSRMQDLVALLSGRNFETRTYEDAIAEESFMKLRRGVLNFMNQTHFERLTMILRSAGFITSSLLRSANAINFAYIIYLRGRAESMPAADIERLVRRWYAMSVLTGRYSSNPETAFDVDIRRIEEEGLAPFAESRIDAVLSDSFWRAILPQELATSSAISPTFLAWRAAQVKHGDLGFLSRDITVRDLLLNRSDVHHVYPKAQLKRQGLSAGRYNQIANYVIAQSEINIAIDDTPPETYFRELADQVAGGPRKYGAITDETELRANLSAHCIPERMIDGAVPSYDDFLVERRTLMADKIRKWFATL